MLPDGDKSVDMWTPYKELLNTIQAVMSRPTAEISPKFTDLLKKHKQNFITLLKNPPKNTKTREELNKGTTEGITLPEVGHQVLSKDLVEEALILSDMYNLNEFMALDILCTAQGQMPYHPGLTRGLVAIILYYDGRKSLVLALKELVLRRRGFTFSAECSEDVANYITEYTTELMDNGLIERILELIESLDLSKEIELLQQNRAIGGAKHHKQVVDLFTSTRQTLSEIVFFWATQCGLPKDTTIKLINLLKKTKLEEESHGGINNVTLILEVALLGAMDLNILQRCEDSEVPVQEHPLISDKTFLPALLKELSVTNPKWESHGLQALTSLALALSLATLKIAPQNLQAIEINDEDETIVDAAIEQKVFEFLYTTFFENQYIFEEEFLLRRLHTLMTDFIVLMPLKVRELKNKGEEASRVTQMYCQQGLEAPQNLPHHFEHLLLSISKLYRKDPCNLELCLEYWCPPEVQVTHPYRSQSRQVSLFKFVRLSNEMVPSLLFVPYLKMLSSLANSPEAARHAFAMLKQQGASSNNAPASNVSWDHFFLSLNCYYSNLRQELPPGDTVYRHRGYAKGITPQEIQGLHAVLQVLTVVAEKDEYSRLAFCENPNWAPLTVLLGLMSCSVPIILKANLLNALAALAKTPTTAVTLWHNLEVSQIITTIPSTSSYTPRGVKTELDEIESRNEEYPLTRALLHLLDVLTDVPIPRLLGSGTRTPGFDPYLHFIIDSVFLKFNHRSYKYAEEKWNIANSCLKLLVKFLKQYEPLAEDFFGTRLEVQGRGTTQVSPPPGYHLMINMNNKSELLRLILYLIDESVNHLDTYSIFPGKEALEGTALRCLELIDTALQLQPKFMNLVTNVGASLLLTGLSKLILGTNPRTGKPDHLLNITKFVTYSTWLPRQAYHAVKIISVIAAQPATQSHLVGLFTATPTLKTEIRHGFVECLESVSDDGSEYVDEEDELGIQSRTKELILKLVQKSLSLPPPNIAHYLTGFDLNKDIRKMIFQQPGILQTPRTVLHSLLALLNLSVKARTGLLPFLINPRLVEAAYSLLYQLCSNPKTSGPILRFLRSNSDFLSRHIECLPFKPNKNASERNQMAYLMKIIAIELKILAVSKQQAQVELLINLLVGDQSDEDVRSNDDAETESSYNPRLLDPDYTQSVNSSMTAQKKNDQRFLKILNLIHFNTEPIVRPNWEYFDANEVEVGLLQCEEPSTRLIDVKKVHRILTEELAAQKSSTASQRQLILKEIKEICAYALNKNKEKDKSSATLQLLDAWRQLTEIIFAVTPHDILQNDYRQELIIDTLHSLVYRVVSVDQAVPELAAMASEVVFLLLVYLRQCQSVERREGKESKMRRIEETGEIAIMLSTLQANWNTLKNIVCGIVQWILNSGVATQKLRSNLYGSFLNFLYITCVENTPEDSDDDGLHTSRLDNSRYKIPNESESDQRKIILKIISGFGEGLAEVLCHDCSGGHDMCKMLALSCLDVLLELDPYTSWVSHLSTRGYLQHIIDGLVDADDELVEICANDRVTTLRPLYVFESKLVLLSRIAGSSEGAILLIEHSALNCLSSMKVFDVQNRSQLNDDPVENEFLPSQVERFHQVLFPAINLLDVVITSLGTENRSSNEAVVHFLLSHADMVCNILRPATPRSSLPSLKEVARLTSVIARSADIGVFEEAVQFFDANRRHGAHSPYLLKTLMLDLIQRFVITDGIIQDIWNNQPVSSVADSPMYFNSRSDNNIEKIIQLFDIMCNLLIYVRNAISSKDKVDYRATEPVFWPGLTDSQTVDGRSGGKANSEQPLLGHIVQLLVESVKHYHKEKSTLAQLIRKKTALPTMTTSELEQFFSDSLPNERSSDKHVSALKILTKRLEEKTLEMDKCSFVIENSLYIIWSHLDFFLLRALPKPKQGFNFDLNTSTVASQLSFKESSLMNVTSHDISVLKAGLLSIFNDNFSKKIIDTKESQAQTDKNFAEALVRRIKRLIQFVPVK